MGIYIFSWPVLKEALIALKDQSGCDFESTSCLTAEKKARDFLLMNITDTGKMWEPWDPIGKPI